MNIASRSIPQFIHDPAVKWKDKAIELLRRYAKTHSCFIGEEYRALAIKCGLPEPAHPNHWGGVMMAAKHRDYIAPWGMGPYQDVAPMVSPKSHSRKSLVWIAGDAA